MQSSSKGWKYIIIGYLLEELLTNFGKATVDNNRVDKALQIVFKKQT